MYADRRRHMGKIQISRDQEGKDNRKVQTPHTEWGDPIYNEKSNQVHRQVNRC